MTCDFEGSVVKGTGPPPTGHASGDDTGCSQAGVIRPDAHDGRDSVHSNAETARRPSVLVIIMRYRD